MTRRWVFNTLVVFLAVTAFLIIQNPEISPRDNLNRPMAFLSGYVFTLLVLILMTIETPVDHDRRWWEIWKIYDPLTMVLIGFFFSIGVYLFTVYGNFSGRFSLSAESFDWARIVLYIASAAGVIVIPYLIYQAWLRANSDRRRRTAIAVAGYCYGMVAVGAIFHQVSVAFSLTMIGVGTGAIAAVWGWEWYAARNQKDPFDPTRGLP